MVSATASDALFCFLVRQFRDRVERWYEGHSPITRFLYEYSVAKRAGGEPGRKRRRLVGKLVGEESRGQGSRVVKTSPTDIYSHS
jgi:hypothetical protein